MGDTVRFRVREQQVGEIPLLINEPCFQQSHALLLVYGGSREKNFRYKINDFAAGFASEGIMTLCFDFRSNLPQNIFEEYGIRDRVVDTRKVLTYLTRCLNGVSLSVLAVSMGGHVAVTALAEARVPVGNLILIAPAAYSWDACAPQVKFNTYFSMLIRKYRSWAYSPVFDLGAAITARTRIIRYECDEVVPLEVLMRYHASIPFSDLITLRGMRHRPGIVEDERKRRAVSEAVLDFILPRRGY